MSDDLFPVLIIAAHGVGVDDTKAVVETREALADAVCAMFAKSPVARVLVIAATANAKEIERLPPHLRPRKTTD